MSPRTWCVAGALALGFGLLSGCGERSVVDKDILFVDVTQLRVLMDEDKTNPDRLILIDPRIPADFRASHIPTAVNIRLPEIERTTGVDSAIDRHTYIVVYGDDPGSAIAIGMTKKLMSRRYSKVRMFQGGLLEWGKAGFATESGTP